MSGLIDTYGSNIITICTAFGLLAAGGGVVYRKYLRPFIKKVEVFMTRMDAAGEVIDAQLTKNGGSSLVDRANRIEPNHKETTDAIAASDRLIVANHAEAKEHWVANGHRLDSVEKSIEEMRSDTLSAAKDLHKETLNTAVALHKETISTAAAVLKAKR